MQIRKTYLEGIHGQIHARVAGNPAKPPVILLHQTPSSSEMFVPIMQAMADDYYLIAPDLAGFGNSDPIKDETVEQHAAALWSALSGHFQSPAHIIAHHSGVSIAVEMAITNPDAVASLALSGPTIFTDEMKAILPSKSTSFKADNDGSHLNQMWQRIRGKDRTVDLNISTRETLLAIALGDRYGATYKAIIEYETAENMRQITCPTLVFAGTKDILYSALDPAMACLKHGTKAEIDGATGYLFENNTQAVSNLLTQYLKNLDIS